ILIIRLGALGDLVLCFQAFHEIRRAHPKAEIALLTMPAFADFARQMPWFDKVLIDERPSGWQPHKWIELLNTVKAFNPTRVYDLQGKRRQSILYALLGSRFKGPEWSGAAPLCSHPRLWPPQDNMHYTDFVAAQLQRAGVPTQSAADVSWLDTSLDHFNLPPRFALFIPGCAPGRDYKRWPAQHYAILARHFEGHGIACLAVGTAADADVIASIRAMTPSVIDLGGRTNLPQLASLARRSAITVGNDTGPTHLAAAVGAPVLALMSDRVNAVWAVPRGPNVRWLQGKPLMTLSVDKVLLALTDLLDRKN
ncbi:MAG: glycosyltransferase family 9 protein, partial [Alphaproteobacteria bacterium]